MTPTAHPSQVFLGEGQKHTRTTVATDGFEDGGRKKGFEPRNTLSSRHQEGQQEGEDLCPHPARTGICHNPNRQETALTTS